MVVEMGDEEHCDTADELAAITAARLAERLDELSASVLQLVLDEVPELGDAGELFGLYHDVVVANIDTVFSAIRYRIPVEHIEPPTAALEQARRLAQRGVSINAVVRAYRLGHRAVLNAMLDELRQPSLSSQVSVDVFGQIANITFGYIDEISQQVVATYQDARDSWLENRNNLRALRVRHILDGGDVDVDATSSDIDYPIQRTHLAAVIWLDEPGSGDELVHLEQHLQRLADTVGACDAPLFVPIDHMTAWGWIPFDGNSAPAATAELRCRWDRQTGPSLALGDPLTGVEGFRRSHQQAQDAREVALALRGQAPTMVAFSDRGLAVASLVGADLDAAADWVGEVLGPLASRTDGDEVLRDTLRVFLRTGSSFKAAADELHMHHNSVKYRIQRALARRGRPIDDDRLDVEIALVLCQWYGAAVLR